MEVLRLRSFTQPDRDAFTFLLDGETEQTTTTLTYQELDKRSRQYGSDKQGRKESSNFSSPASLLPLLPLLASTDNFVNRTVLGDRVE